MKFGRAGPDDADCAVSGEKEKWDREESHGLFLRNFPDVRNKSRRKITFYCTCTSNKKCIVSQIKYRMVNFKSRV